MLKLKETKLPWNDSLVRSTGNLYTYLMEQLPSSLGCYLPKSFTLFFDPETEESKVVSFLKELTYRLVCEVRTREIRRERFVKLGLFSDINVSYGNEIFEIGAAVMRVIPFITTVVNNFNILTVTGISYLQQIAKIIQQI